MEEGLEGKVQNNLVVSADSQSVLELGSCHATYRVGRTEQNKTRIHSEHYFGNFVVGR